MRHIVFLLNSAKRQGANLRGADLQGAKLLTNLEKADLRGADLRGANLYEANLHGAYVTSEQLATALFLNSTSQKPYWVPLLNCHQYTSLTKSSLSR